jgi:hypothetical protein
MSRRLYGCDAHGGSAGRASRDEDNELDERPRRPPLSIEHQIDLYRGGLEIIADVVRRAEDSDDPADREAAWMTIKSVLREVEKHNEQEEPSSH